MTGATTWVRRVGVPSVVAALVFAALLAVPAGADTTATWNGGFFGQTVRSTSGAGYQAGQFTLDFGGGITAKSYCIDISTTITPGTTLTEAPWESATGLDPADLSRITWILNHYPTDVYTQQWQAAAIQAAIWHFSDGFELSPTLNPANVVALYNEVVAAAEPHSGGSQPPPSLAIDPASGSAYAGDVIDYSVTAANATRDIDVTLSGAGATWSDGTTAPKTLPPAGGTVSVVRSTVGGAALHAETTAQVEAGRVFVKPGKQKLILATTTTAGATADATGMWLERPTGAISVTKRVDGNTAPAPGEGAYELCLTVVGEPAPISCQTVAVGGVAVWSGLLYGEYRVSETTTGAFSTEYVPADGVIVLEGESASGEVVNHYANIGDLAVTKTVSGNTAPAPGAGSFELCVTQLGVEGAVPVCQTVAAGETAVFSDLVWGQYLVEEGTSGGFTTSYVPADGVVTLESDLAAAEVHNAYPNVGDLSVTKQVAGETAPAVGEGGFEVCVQRTDVAGSPTECETVAAGETVTFRDLPWGTYKVTESTTGDFTVAYPEGQSVVLDSESASALVVNTYPDAPPPSTETGGTQVTRPVQTAGEQVERPSGRLPFTGASVLPLVLIGLGLLGLGLGTRRAGRKVRATR